MKPHPPFSPDEIALLRALIKPAIVLLLMMYLDRPIGSREIAEILELNEHTTAKYLRALAHLNLVGRAGRKQGYLLLGGRQLILGALPALHEGHHLEAPERDHTVKKFQLNATTTTTTTIMEESEGEGEVVVEEAPHTVKKLQYETRKRAHTVKKLQYARGKRARTVKNLQFESNKPPGDVDNHPHQRTPPEVSAVHQALLKAGIGEPKRSSLAALPHMTPVYITAWEMRLKKDKGERYSPGLLIHVLESGDPHPQVNEIGHLHDCKCAECRQSSYRRCPYCHGYPCECGEE